MSLCLSTQVSHSIQSSVTWAEAAENCAANNSKLVNVNSSAVQDLVAIFRSDSGLTNEWNWISAHEKNPLTDKQFRWITGNFEKEYQVTILGPITRWFIAVNPPNVLWNLPWNALCSYICQTTDSCSDEDLLLDSTCYKKREANVTWYEASKSCLQLTGGKLATFPNLQTISRTHEWILSSQAYWIGLTNVWWIDEDGVDILYTNWQADQPPLVADQSKPVSHSLCALMQADSTWITRDCGIKAAYICQAYQYDESCSGTAKNSTSATTTTVEAATTITSGTTTVGVRTGVPLSTASTFLSVQYTTYSYWSNSTSPVQRTTVTTVPLSQNPSSTSTIGVIVGVGGGVLLVCLIASLTLYTLFKTGKLQRCNHTAVDKRKSKFSSDSTNIKLTSSSKPRSTAIDVVYAQVVPVNRQPEVVSDTGNSNALTYQPVIYAELESVTR